LLDTATACPLNKKQESSSSLNVCLSKKIKNERDYKVFPHIFINSKIKTVLCISFFLFTPVGQNGEKIER
jgi:hypothetical protein